MQVTFVILSGFCTLVLATPITKNTGYYYDYKIANKEFLKKQQSIFQLFQNVFQSTYHKNYLTYGKDYDMEEHLDLYRKPEVVKEFNQLFQRGLMANGEIFSVFHEDHLKEAVALFKVLYYAKDWESFLKTAWWARQNINAGQYIYALSVAVAHRPDCERLILPPIYEINPYYFLPIQTVHDAQKFKQNRSPNSGIQFNTNFNLHKEHSLSYFTNDIGVNAFYYYYNLYYPFWMSSEEFHIKNPHRGEQFYYVHQQLLARYNLERVSMGFGEIPRLHWDRPIEKGFYPNLQYYNGIKFPDRPSNLKLHDKFLGGHQSHTFNHNKYISTYTSIQDYERRIRDAIDQGFIFAQDGERINLYDEHGMETLANLIEGNSDSSNPRFYGNLQILARHLLGYSHTSLDKYENAPSALEHFETSLRDPLFYQFFKRIVMDFQKYRANLPAYKYDYLYFPGVKVEDVNFDKLATYFDYFYHNVMNVVSAKEEEFANDTFYVCTRRERLNHKNFTYKIYVSSENPVDAMVRVFIGPKYDENSRELNITWNRLNFVEFDRFTYKLKEGSNVIERNSLDTWNCQGNFTPPLLYETLEDALSGTKEFKLYDHNYYYGFPSRFLLPRGSEAGTAFQFYFIVSPYQPEKIAGQNEWYFPMGFQHKYVDGFAYGYPFDRPIYNEQKFKVPNSYFHEVKIYHKGFLY